MSDQMPLSHGAIEQNFERLGRYLRRKFGENDQRVDDIAQAVWTKLASIDDTQFARIRHVWAYIVKMSYHAMCDQTRKTPRQGEQVEWTDEVEQLHKREEDPTDSLLDTDPGLIGHYLDRALEALPKPRAAIIHCHLYEGHSFEEMARKLNCSPDTVRRYYDDSIALIYAKCLS
jgi:RNA polymerase sigma factor (sigma-70 family)